MTTVTLHEPSTHTPFAPRGPFSDALLGVLFTGAHDRVDELPSLARAAAAADDPIFDDDLQLGLFLLYAIAYGSIDGIDAAWEWDGRMLEARAALERAFERDVRARCTIPELPERHRDAVAAALFAMTAPQPGPSLSQFVARKADEHQVRELLIQRSIYTLREADPHSWTIPRLAGRAKVALVEIQSDEYGAGDPDRMHQVMFARAMRGAGLDDRYGAYLDAVPAITLASVNLISLFGMNRRLRGASVGHLAAFEMTSSLPSRRIADGLRRLGFGEDVTAYYDEHVEADAVHEQIAARDLAGSLAEDEPDLLPDILFGAAACLLLDGWAADHVLESWQAGTTSLRTPVGATPGAARVGDSEGDRI